MVPYNMPLYEAVYIVGGETNGAGPRGEVGSASDLRTRGPGLDIRFGYLLVFLLPLI